MKKANVTYKVIFIGDVFTGKTSIIRKKICGETEKGYFCTVGNQIYTLENESSTHNILLQIFDTMGSEDFMSLTQSELRNSSFIVYVCSFDNKSSLYSLKSKWIPLVNEIVDSSSFYPYIVANKCDIPENERCFLKSELDELSEEMNAKLFCTSTKENIQVDKLFIEFFMDIKSHLFTSIENSKVRIQSLESLKSVDLSRSSDASKNKGCCG